MQTVILQVVHLERPIKLQQIMSVAMLRIYPVVNSVLGEYIYLHVIKFHVVKYVKKLTQVKKHQ